MTDTRQPTGLISTSDYKITTLAIYTSAGQVVDVSKISLGIDIFEDIFSPVITGTLRLGDGGDLISNFQFQGNEFLLLEIDKPSLNRPITKIFRIYKIGDREFGTSSLQNYTLYFASEELILSNQLMISKSYKGLQISTMVNDLLVNKLKVNKNKMVNGIFETTSGSFDLIVPRMGPLEAVQWLSPRAYNVGHNLFLFFENREGFNFTSYENLLNQPLYNTYSRSVKISTDPADNFASVNYMKVVEDFDTLKSLRYGAYVSTLMTLDIVNRKMSAKTFGYRDLQQKAILNKQAPNNGMKTRAGLSLLDSSASMVKYIVSADSDPTTNPAHIENWMPQSIARLAQINSFKMVMTVPGDIFLRAGAVVGVVMPKMIVQEKSTQVDELRTGRYLVSAIHHSFKQDIMLSSIELISDSVSATLAPPLDNSTSLNKIIQS